ncbi:hypothetical protein HU200_024048 [Digitaria exilis]|uniref:F-box domain-containing protein n=1 Tax=Digitaria exilis TaxID=1010633 RepID=A0A835EVT0_9POAL|nr:hypothetical protein HU200_024048 [Digitaria exilis]
MVGTRRYPTTSSLLSIPLCSPCLSEDGGVGTQWMMEAAGGCIRDLCDGVLADILARLPSASVLRCRVVCKSWRRVTTHRSFLAAHAARRPREMILRPQFYPKAVSTRQRLLSFHPCCDGFVFERYSLDGLLVRMQHSGLFAICNPTTRQWTNLPALTPEPCCSAGSGCGFYLHRSSGEYRLLCDGIERNEAAGSNPELRRYYYIIAASTARPRRLARAPSNPSLLYEAPVAYRGVLHWLYYQPEARRTGKMLAFDTEAETFRHMSQPIDRDTKRNLFELDGCLGVAAVKSLTSLDIWVLEDYKMERWELRHRIDNLPMPRLYYEREVSVSRVISVGSDAILIGSPGCYVARMYDLKEKKVIYRDFELGEATPTFLVFTESLVRHELFDSCPRSPDLEPIDF